MTRRKVRDVSGRKKDIGKTRGMNESVDGATGRSVKTFQLGNVGTLRKENHSFG